jgi:hypothetical protein
MRLNVSGYFDGCGFECKGIFDLFKIYCSILHRMCRKRGGGCAMPSAWLKENVYDSIESGKLSYVTSDGMHNFAGETIGDRAAMLMEVKVAWQLVLLPACAMHVNFPGAHEQCAPMAAYVPRLRPCCVRKAFVNNGRSRGLHS